ncbi:ATP-binding cassette domain-containing protein [Parabacteroides sp. FAFU027]|uniref:ABC transporter ATP-binding protein n=1 Tax=Parabacteroides sp. FAFU027 TaxID=2922715 RepID=UPI001FAFCE26|nr:ABC transporter ATP-binding protein [Parabacteroides sp. FAFU027]
MIQFENITISYNGKTVINNFSTDIKAGEKICFVGESGSGKSTLLHAILGFVQPESGEIRIDSEAISAHSIHTIRAKTAFLPQDISFPYPTVKELLLSPFSFKANRKKTVSDERILSVFTTLNLEKEILHKKLNEISGGQKQRVLLALIALLDKPIVLLDEPTSALDAGSVDLVIRFLKEMKNTTVVIVTHDRRFAEAFDRIIPIN